MKKLFAIILAVALFASMATVVSAANTTTLTTTVPAATYTLNIPADQKIPFGATATDIGAIHVTDSNGFAVGKDLMVTVTYTDFTSENVSTTIPFEIWQGGSATLSSASDQLINNGDAIKFLGRSNGTVYEYINGNGTFPEKYTFVVVDSTDWGKALAGEYTATITFTAEVVAE